MYIRNKVNRNIYMWWITLAAASLTTNPLPLHEEKNSQKLEDWQIVNDIKVLRYSNIDVF